MVHKHISAEGAADVGLGAVFRSLGGFLELLSELAAQVEGGALRRSGELVDEKQGVKVAYGCSARVGVDEAREPVVDVFDEGNHLLVVAELPGVDASDVGFEVKEDVLELSAARGAHRYRKEVLLPSAVRARAADSSYRNGVLVLRLHKGR
jgi:HSP20 family protein